MRYIFFLAALMTGFSGFSQYTEVINSNHPGESQGAYAVGTGVLQFEGRGHYGVDDHKLTNTKTNIAGLNYEVRYGFWKEQLEINLKGDFIYARPTYPIGGRKESISLANFKFNTLGIKYLLYDPYKRLQEEGPNLYSWRANNIFHWSDLIPAVSIYAGANLLLGTRPGEYPFFGDEMSSVSPKVVLITQNNWGGTVLVTNFEFDYLTEKHKRFSSIFTLTQNLTPRFSLMGEFQIINNHFYSDEIVRFGAAYLLSKNFQVDLSGLTNFKNTPRRWEVGLGISYRFDLHTDELLKDKSGRDRKNKKNEVRPEEEESNGENNEP